MTLRRTVSHPVALSVALHGVAAVALGAFALSPPAASVPPPAVTVELVTLPKPAEPVVEPAPPPTPTPVKPAVKHVAARKVHHVTVKRAASRPAARAVARVPAVAKPVALASGPIPAFKELPHVPASVLPVAVAQSRPAVFSLPDSMEPTTMSLSAGAGSALISRPLPGASGGGRLLRDSAAEAGSLRSKAQAGNNPSPEYPRAAREAGWEGTVILRVLVLPDGSAGAVTLQKTSGHSILDEAALSAVKDWRFIPAMDGHFPVRSTVHLPVRFDLKAAN